MYDLIYSDPMDYNQAVKSAEYLIANDVEAQKMWIAKAPEGFPCPFVEGKRERRREADAFLTGVTQSKLYWEEWKAEKLARRVDGAEVPQGNDMERTSGDD